MIITTTGNRLKMIGVIFSNEESYFEYYFAQLESQYDTIYVDIHTKGGDVYAGNYIEQRLRLSKPKIVMRVLGTAYSMGSIWLTAADETEIVSNGFVMIHQAQGTTRGTAKDHKTNAELLEDMNTNFKNRLVAKTGKTEKYVQKWLGEGDTYFNAEKAVKEGIIDRIVDPVIDVKIDDKTALSEADVYGQFSALLTQTETKNNFKSKPKKMKSAIIAKYGLTGVTDASSDTAVFEALDNHFKSQKESIQKKYDALKTDHDTLSGQVKTEKEAQINALLKPLEGKLDKKKIDAYRAIGENGSIESLQLALEGVQGRQNITSIISGKTGEGASIEAKEGWDWDKYQKEDPRGIELLSQQNPNAFNALYKAKFGKDFKSI